MDSDPREIVLRFEPQVASLDSIQRATLKFTNLCAFEFSSSDGGIALTVTFPFRHQVDRDELIGRLRNEILDQSLRERIANETAQERNLILAYAFSNTKLIGQ